MAFEFNREHRKVYSEKLLDLANLAVAGLIFGQFLSERKFSEIAAVVGLVFLLVIYWIVYLLLKRKRQ